MKRWGKLGRRTAKTEGEIGTQRIQGIVEAETVQGRNGRITRSDDTKHGGKFMAEIMEEYPKRDYIEERFMQLLKKTCIRI